MKKIGFLIIISLISAIEIYAQDIPNAPSDVYVDPSTNILMLKKPIDNSYQQFVVKGVNWSPATRASEEIFITFGLPCSPCWGGIPCPTSGSAWGLKEDSFLIGKDANHKDMRC